VAFDQVSPLGELSVRWTGGANGEAVSELRIDEFEGAPEPARAEPTDETEDAEEETG